jgi:hypothetical protein
MALCRQPWRVGRVLGGPTTRTLGRVDRRERRLALGVTAAVVLGVALPGIRMTASGDAPESLPLSAYSMFARDRGRVVEQPTVVAVSPGGYVERLSPETIAATDQVMQAAKAVRRALDAGPAATRLLCDEVAGRVDAPAIVAVWSSATTESHGRHATAGRSTGAPWSRARLVDDQCVDTPVGLGNRV